MKLTSGMHPGVVNGKREYPVANTSAPKSKARLQRALDGITAHVALHPKDGMSQQRIATIKGLL